MAYRVKMEASAVSGMEPYTHNIVSLTICRGEISDVDPDKFQVGVVYYQLWAWAGPNRSHVVSTWLYQGRRDRRECVGSERRFCFVELNAWMSRGESTDGASARGVTYSYEDAAQCMLIWDELAEKIDHLLHVRNRGERNAGEGDGQDSGSTGP